eukprot:2406740-Amphidinium_carterae.1
MTASSTSALRSSGLSSCIAMTASSTLASRSSELSSMTMAASLGESRLQSTLSMSSSQVAPVASTPQSPRCWMWNANGVFCQNLQVARPKIKQVRRALAYDVVAVVETHEQGDRAEALHVRQHRVFSSCVEDASKHSNTGGVLLVLRREWLHQRSCEKIVIVPGRALFVRFPDGELPLSIMVAHVYRRDDDEWQQVLQCTYMLWVTFMRDTLRIVTCCSVTAMFFLSSATARR